MRKIFVTCGALFAVIHGTSAMAADGIECVATDLTQGTMDGLGAVSATQFAENPAEIEPGQIEEFTTILAACAGQWNWTETETTGVLEYSMAYLGTRYAYNTLQTKKAFAIEPFYEFVSQLSAAEVQTALDTQVFGEERKAAFIKMVVAAMGEDVTQDDVMLFHGFLIAQLKMDDAERRLKTL